MTQVDRKLQTLDSKRASKVSKSTSASSYQSNSTQTDSSSRTPDAAPAASKVMLPKPNFVSRPMHATEIQKRSFGGDGNAAIVILFSSEDESSDEELSASKRPRLMPMVKSKLRNDLSGASGLRSLEHPVLDKSPSLPLPSPSKVTSSSRPIIPKAAKRRVANKVNANFADGIDWIFEVNGTQILKGQLPEDTLKGIEEAFQYWFSAQNGVRYGKQDTSHHKVYASMVRTTSRERNAEVTCVALFVYSKGCKPMEFSVTGNSSKVCDACNKSGRPCARIVVHEEQYKLCFYPRPTTVDWKETEHWVLFPAE
ncbi:hypothetical protein NX059_000813 [Plenodomus lindquistii]|nr:hypothetical protein NX059_000813 [Plenodomus lindquistii]